MSSAAIHVPEALEPLLAPRPIPRTKMQIILPAVIGLAVLGMIALMMSQPALRSGPMAVFSLLFPIMMIGSMLYMFTGNRFGGVGDNQQLTPAQMEIRRREYFHDLDELRDEVHAAAEAQFNQFRWLHPEPDQLLGLVGSDRMWERSRKN
ncbi:hypothetical protein AFM11_30260 [Mycolicibacterium wolinskyi]|uniref:Cell division protein FtsK n=1 Tax=Mycolicibacterium wolinskyi TaxID=59750 RepID=A0A132PEP6_9MYCO|nr:hypothetical protein [Mycolicibacterium wolinskyi]KWX20462.1 hypothetical protein AFM11_30260 [Mycolicibacterium wolinskyi]